MYCNYDIVKAMRKYQASDTFKYRLSEDEKSIVNKETSETISSVAEFTDALRKKDHCDFEVVYDEHVSLSVVLRCRECGTVIFSRDDEDYDPNLKCPTCGGYETHFQYYTKEQIDADPVKQEEIKAYEQMQATMEAMAKRRQCRGLADWEICKKQYKLGDHKYELSLECQNLFSQHHKGIMRLKGLNLNIQKWTKDENAGGYVRNKSWRIPLSPYAAYIQWVVPMTRPCRMHQHKSAYSKHKQKV